MKKQNDKKATLPVGDKARAEKVAKGLPPYEIRVEQGELFGRVEQGELFEQRAD